MEEKYQAESLIIGLSLYTLLRRCYGRQLRMFFGSLETGTNNAVIYTLLANCRTQGLDPEDAYNTVTLLMKQKKPSNRLPP